MDEEFMKLIPAHRTYINFLINKNTIDSYAVSMESQTVWITINAEDKAGVDEYLSHSPLFKFWIYEVDELFVLDGLTYRLPHLQLRGLMAVPEATDDAALLGSRFAALRHLRDRINATGLKLDTLSMGMSHDLEIAIAEGATMVRVGTAIFGERK